MKNEKNKVLEGIVSDIADTSTLVLVRKKKSLIQLFKGIKVIMITLHGMCII